MNNFFKGASYLPKFYDLWPVDKSLRFQQLGGKTAGLFELLRKRKHHDHSDPSAPGNFAQS